MTKLRKLTSRVALTALATVALSSSTVLGAVYEFGTGTATNGDQAYPTPMGNYYWGNRTQYLYEATELTGAGMVAGEMISEVGFYIENVNSMPDLENFTISLKNTSVTDMTAWDAGTTLVYGPVTLPVASLTSGDWNSFVLDSQFTWDGMSNITVEICSNNSAWIAAGNASVRYTTTTSPSPSARYYRADNATVCPSTLQTGTSSDRANLRLVANPPTAEDIGAAGIVPPNPPFAGQTQDFGVTIANVGTSGITADGNIDLDVDGDGIYDASGTFTGLAGGTTMTYNVSATVPLAAGSATAIAAVTLTSGVDGNTSNDTSSVVSYTILPTEDVEATSITPVSAFANDFSTFDIVVTNNGLNPADGDVNLDVDNDGITDATGNFTGLGSGASTTVQIVAASPATVGTFTASATAVLTSGVDQDPSNDTATTPYTTVPTEDVEAVSVTATPNPVPAGGSVSFDVLVSNNGNNPADILVEIDWDNDGVTDGSSNITGLASGATQTETFNATAPGTAGNATAEAFVTLLSGVDQDATNDTTNSTYAVTPSCVTSYPYTENFDTWATGNGAFDVTTGWVQDTADNQNWTVFGGNTGSFATGPTQDYTAEQGLGSGLYLYTETSGPPFGSVFNALSICFDLSSLAAPKLSHFFHMKHNLNTTGEFHVDVINLTTGITDSSVWSQIGEFQPTEGSPWENAITSLLPYAGDTIQLRFRAISGSTGFNYEYDTALDQVSIFDAADDISITAFAVNGAASAGNPIAFDVQVVNTGSNSADGNVDVDVDNDGIADGNAILPTLASGDTANVTVNTTAPGTAATYTAVATANLTSATDGNPSDNTSSLSYVVAPNEDASANSIVVTPNPVPAGDPVAFDVEVGNNGGSAGDILVEIDWDDDGVADDSNTITGLASGATQTVTFNGTAPGTAGNITATAFVTLQSGVDGDTSNDTTNVSYAVTPSCVTTYPYLENFDSWATTATGGVITLDITTGWINDTTGDDRDWAIFAGSTTSSATGPTQDYTSEQGLGTGNYAYTETSSPVAFGDIFSLTSICYDLSSLAAPKLSFFYHMKHNFHTDGEFHIDVINLTTGVTDSSIWSQVGEVQPTEASPWENAITSLLPYAGDTIQLRFRAVVGNQGFAFEYDTGLDEVSIFDAADDITVTAFSLVGGLAPAGNPISFDVQVVNTGSNVADGNVEVDVDNDGVADGTDSFTGLASGDTANFTINTTAPGTAGPYTAAATANLTSAVDGNPADNTAELTYTVTPNEDLAILSVTPDALVFIGNPMNVDVEVTNLGGVTGDGSVDIDVDGDGVSDGTNTFTGLASGDTTTVTVTATAPGTIGPYDVEAAVTLTSGVDGDTSNDTLAVAYNALPTADVGIPGFDWSTTTAGASPFTIGVIVTNFSLNAADGTVDIDFDNDGTADDSDTFAGLASGASDTLYFVTTSVASGNQTVSATVTQTNDVDQDPTNDTFAASYFAVPASGGPDTFGHTWISSLDGAFAYNFIDISNNIAAVNQNLTDDSFSTVTLGAPFDFYGTSETSLNICSNGWVNFGAGNTSLGGPAGTAFPNAGIPNGVIAIFWDDLNPSSQGDVFFLDNTAVDNRSYIQWNDIVAFSGSVQMTFQIVLDHSNGNIEYHYMDIDENDATFSSIGIENQGGTDGLQISNDAPFVSDGLGVQIKAPLTQPDPPVVTINGATLSWPAVTGAQNYWVYTSATPNGPWSPGISVGNVLTWTDPAGTGATENNYYVTSDSDAPVVAPSKSQNQVTSVAVNYNNPNPYGLPTVVTPEVIAKYTKLKAEGVLSQTELNWLQKAITSPRNATRSSVNK